MDWDREHAVKIDCAPAEASWKPVDTVRVQAGSRHSVHGHSAGPRDEHTDDRPRPRGNESGHCGDGQPVALTTAIAETPQSAVTQCQTLACRSTTFGMEQILLKSSSPLTTCLSTRTWRLQQHGQFDTRNRIRRRSVSWTDLDSDDREATTTAAPIEVDTLHQHRLADINVVMNSTIIFCSRWHTACCHKAPADPRPAERHSSGMVIDAKKTTIDYLEDEHLRVESQQWLQTYRGHSASS